MKRLCGGSSRYSLVTACALRYSATAPARSTLYVNALKDVIASSPRAGIHSDLIAKKLSELLHEDADPTRFGFSKLTQALSEVNDIHYIAKKSILVPCDWKTVLQKIHSKLPPEGVLKPQFIRLVSHECPHFNTDSIPGSNIEGWIASRFSHLFTITPSSSKAHCIFRAAVPNNLRNGLTEQIYRALALLDRDPQIPVKTDLESIRPLLSSGGKTGRSWVETAFTNPIVGSSFDVEVDVEFVVDVLSVMPHSIFVDGTSVSQCDIVRAARVAGLDPHVVRSLSAKLLGNNDTSSFLQLSIVRRASSPPVSPSDVVLDSFIDARDELGAMLAQRLAQNSKTNILVVVGKQALEGFNEMIRDSFSAETAKQIRLVSPD